MPVPCFDDHAPASTLPSVPRQQHGFTTPTVLLMALAVVALLGVGYFAVKLFSPPTPAQLLQQGPVFTSKPLTASPINSATDMTKTPDPSDTPAERSAEAVRSQDKSTPSPLTTNSHSDDLSLSEFAISSIPDPKAILQAKLPETESLAKEEIDRLEDDRKRWVEQEKLAKEQLQLAAEIEQKKAAQIALIKQQIAQLEKDHAAAKL